MVSLALLWVPYIHQPCFIYICSICPLLWAPYIHQLRVFCIYLIFPLLGILYLYGQSCPLMSTLHTSAPICYTSIANVPSYEYHANISFVSHTSIADFPSYEHCAYINPRPPSHLAAKLLVNKIRMLFVPWHEGILIVEGVGCSHEAHTASSVFPWWSDKAQFDYK